jgi:predicted DNA-binding protein (UPF0251 family)
MANEIDYMAVLADLKAQRQALDNIIDGLERWLKGAAIPQRDSGSTLAPRYSTATTTNSDRIQQQVSSKLTVEQIEQLRVRSREGKSQTAIAQEFGISQASVSRILRNTPQRHSVRGPRLTVDQIEEIKSRHSRGEKQAEIARIVGVSRGSVWNVVKGKRGVETAA